ncbi:hypothetical protein Niako_0518 [Niastella koreensis GR20-10]|uniref:Uncharacterized protein n=1 Tax=Niastella koreensis (strain DSM 17620 / KACC 11465 / NBRC 106392 / GR20-10) TaxID=700598 RepID=G8T7X5_NIAKG|nr:hypothetical protein Niako_0518 [Niastella koreensis GR20-10]
MYNLVAQKNLVTKFGYYIGDKKKRPEAVAPAQAWLVGCFSSLEDH